MAVIQITIPDANVDRIMPALEARFPRTVGETNADLFRRWTRARIINIVRQFESDAAATAVLPDEGLMP